MNEKQKKLGLIAEEREIPGHKEMNLHLLPDLTVSFHTPDVHKGMQHLKETGPDGILIQLGLLKEDPAGFLMRISLVHPEIKTLILVEEYSLDSWLQWMKAGAKAVLESGFAAQTLASSARVVIQGGIYLGAERTEPFFEGCARAVTSEKEKEVDLLTEREIQVLKCLAEGTTVRQAADLLKLSEKTANTHRANLMRKLNIHKRQGLIKFALKKKIISIE